MPPFLVSLGSYAKNQVDKNGHLHYRPAMETVICLPTYNEKDNLERLVRALMPLGVDVLVIDDNSPDGTGQIADRLASEFPSVHVMHRQEKDGLGRAYIAGMKWALAQGAEFIVQMDCDFSHRPEDLPAILAAAKDGADLVIGSRYVPGGKVTGWGLKRHVMSRGGSFYARTLLGIKTRDLTTGFKCFRRGALEAIDLDTVPARGYVFLLEMTYRTLRKGFRVVEVPILFADREVGVSKMSKKIFVEALLRVPSMRLAALRGQM